MNPENLIIEIANGVGTITLNRPDKYNALNQAIKTELMHALLEMQKDKSVKVVILTGSGKGFCAGADLSDFGGNITPDDVHTDLQQNYGGIIRHIIHMDKPIICAINGPVAGAGIGIALACDYKVMAETASLRYAFVNIALVPDAGSSWFLLKTVGYSKAMEIITGGEKISAQECLKLNIVNKVVPTDQVSEVAMEWASKLAKGPAKAIAGTKRILQHAMNHGLMETMDLEAREQRNCILGKDNMEGITAFMQKRSPNFTEV